MDVQRGRLLPERLLYGNGGLSLLWSWCVLAAASQWLLSCHEANKGIPSGTYIVYEALWGCNVAILLVILGVFLSKPFLVGVAVRPPSLVIAGWLVLTCLHCRWPSCREISSPGIWTPSRI